MVAFQIFGFSVYRYGIFYAIAFLLGYFGLAWIGQKKRFSHFTQVQHFLTEGLENLILAIAVGVLVWGRLGHVLIYGNGYYFHHLGEMFKVWGGGMSFIGGILGVLASVAVLCMLRKLTKRDFLMLFDLMLLFVPLGIFFGRFGNYLNQELYGIPVSELPNWLSQIFSSLGLVHQYSQVDELQRVNTNFLSMLLEGLVLFGIQLWGFLRAIKKKRRKVWTLATNFLLYYSLIRFLLEYLRADSQQEIIVFLSKSQRFFLVFIGVALLIKWKMRKSERLELRNA